jgi:DNA-directed RNA polymerase subunit RPC12/RpoP
MTEWVRCINCEQEYMVDCIFRGNIECPCCSSKLFESTTCYGEDEKLD